ncbi:MAG: PrsW family intramembrane metalloprotease [Anaerolineae bacterium]|nr:PrsW family intramembrane metalloprotease [Gloeobacterales cyanobacterium ES-bin-313]
MAELGKGIKQVVQDLNSVNLNMLVPLALWGRDRAWNLPWVRWLLLFALTPLVLIHLTPSELGLQQVAWVFGFYFALLWGLLLYRLIEPGGIRLGSWLWAGLFTLLLGIPVVIGLAKLPFIGTLYAAREVMFVPVRILGYVLGVGVVEESVKLLPVWWLSHRRILTNPRELMFAGAVSGLGFGLAESVAYSTQIAQKELHSLSQGAALVGYFTRFITTPFLHAIFAAIVAYFLGLALVDPKRGWALTVAGLLLAALLHGLYDSFANHWLGLIIAALSILIFVSYVRSAEYIAADLARTPNASDA